MLAYTYRGDGNIASERDHNNVTTTYTYDLLGRLISEVGGYSRYYTYDAAGNRTQAIVDTSTTISYAYDSDIVYFAISKRITERRLKVCGRCSVSAVLY